MFNSKKAVVSLVTALFPCLLLFAQIVEKEGDTWAVNVPAGACARPTASDFSALAGETVHKRGEGRLALTRTAARDLDLVYEAGSLELMCAREVPEDWYYRAETAIKVGNVTQSIRTETGDPFDLGGGALAVGTNTSWGSTVTSRKVPVRLDGKMSISGRVTLSGTGAWGLAIVLHNDLRGYEAKGTQAGNEGLCYAQTTDPILKSFAVGFVNFHKKDYFGRYRIGRNGNWTETATTDPMIFFNTADTTVTPEVASTRVFDFVLASDTSAKTVTLTLTQEQDGADVVFTRTLENTDLTEICEGNTAYLAFTTDSGGRTTYGTISNLRINDGQDDTFLKSLVVTTASPEIIVSSNSPFATNRLAGTVRFTAPQTDVSLVNLDSNDQVLNLGVCSSDGDISFSSLPNAVSVPSDAANGLWHYDRFNANGDSVAAASESPYQQNADGTIGLRVGSATRENVSLTARKRPIAIAGRMRVSGRATMTGSGAWGFALVLHNDPRGFSACGEWNVSSDLGYHSATNASAAITNSLAIGFVNYTTWDHMGQYRFGRNGRWEDAFDKKNPDNRYITDPMIYFNTYAGEKDANGKDILLTRTFDFALESDTVAKTVTLTLKQEQDDKVEPVVFTRMWTGVDLTEICGSEKAYLAFTSATGGRTTSVLIDGLEVAYASDLRFGIVTDGVLSLPTDSILSLDAVDFGIDRNDKVTSGTRARLSRGARLSVAPGVAAFFRSATVSGETFRRGTWTALDCDWVEGLGSVILGTGFCLIIR